MNNKISIIVPIYNVELYLRKCVDSILTQTYKNLEIILVDDGSPDNCAVICDEYAQKDNRIRVIHKKNGGLSDARNAGMEIMTGDYVGFIDSDDWIEPMMYEKLLDNMLAFNADISFGGVADETEKDGIVECTKVSNYGDTPFAEDRISAMKRYFNGSWSAWDKLYKAEIFKNIRYPVGEINEDEAIVLDVLDCAEKVCYTNEVFYHYMKRVDNKTITSSDFSVKKLAWVNHCEKNLKTVQRKYPELELDAAMKYRSSLLWALREITLSDKSFDEEIKELLSKIRNNSSLFLKAHFKNNNELVRFLMMLLLPFKVNKKILNKRHSV